MIDGIFRDPRLADVYDPLEPDRSDLDAYVALVDEFAARSVIDIGCGTGTFACLLAGRGVDVIGIDPAGASVDVARRKRNAGDVRWLIGGVEQIPAVEVDLVSMTGNVAQCFLTDEEWLSTLQAVRVALKPAGSLVFEVRDPAKEAWREWTRERTSNRADLPDVGVVENWVEVTDVTLPFVSFRWSFLFRADGAFLTSDSTLRFRSRAEIEESLRRSGFSTEEVRDATDRRGREFVFLARKSE